MIFGIFILLVYAALIIAFVIGWRRIPFFEAEKKDESDFKLSIVVTCRNEEKNLPALLKCFKNQSFENFELIIVNDHSSDGTFSILTNSSLQQLKTINATAYGKKAALAEGINAATGELIVTTDADCVFGNDWLSAIAAYYSLHKPDLIIGPVVMTNGKNIFENLQSVEFSSLVGSTAGAVGMNHPIMCNGANLAFKKEIWLQANDALHHQVASGDDIFLLQFVKRQKGKIGYLKSKKAKVITVPQPTLKEFIRQRTRWTGKSVFYTDFDTIFTAVTVLGISIAEIFFLFYNIQLFLLIFSVKLLVDFIFFGAIKHFFLSRFNIFQFFLLSVAYPFYVCFTVFLSLFRNKKKW